MSPCIFHLHINTIKWKEFFSLFFFLVLPYNTVTQAYTLLKGLTVCVYLVVLSSLSANVRTVDVRCVNVCAPLLYTHNCLFVFALNKFIACCVHIPFSSFDARRERFAWFSNLFRLAHFSPATIIQLVIINQFILLICELFNFEINYEIRFFLFKKHLPFHFKWFFFKSLLQKKKSNSFFTPWTRPQCFRLLLSKFSIDGIVVHFGMILLPLSTFVAVAF